MSAAVETRLKERGLLADVDALCQQLRVPRAKVLGRDRHGSIARARRALYQHLRSLGLSYFEIGALLDRDHSTILAACREPVRLRVVP